MIWILSEASIVNNPFNTKKLKILFVFLYFIIIVNIPILVEKFSTLFSFIMKKSRLSYRRILLSLLFHLFPHLITHLFLLSLCSSSHFLYTDVVAALMHQSVIFHEKKYVPLYHHYEPLYHLSPHQRECFRFLSYFKMMINLKFK